MRDILVIHARRGRRDGLCDHLAAAAERGFGMRRLLSAESMLLLANKDALVEVDQDLALVGHAFTQGPARNRNVAIHPDEEAVARVTRATREHWGDHIAVASTGLTTAIATSAFGQHRVFRRSFHDTELLSTSPALLHALTAATPQIDWTQFADFLRWPEVRPVKTCLDGLTRLPAATCLQLTANQSTTHALWSPWAHVEPTGADLFELAGDLEACIDSCMRAWSRRFRSPLLELSGGLDSSIIAASLARARGSFAAVTMVPASADGNEESYAASVSDALSLELQAVEVTSAAIDLSIVPDRLTPEPTAHLVGAHVDRLLAAIATQGAHDAFFNGGGGDNVFARMSSAVPLADRARAHASPLALWRTLDDIARLTTATHSATLVNAWRRLRPRDADRWPADSSLLAEQSGTARPDHPWLCAPPGTLPGKKRHVQSLIAAQSYGDTAPRQSVAPLVLPLLSQPIVELCLAIPSWHWVAGGVDRAVARHAFAVRLPPSVTARRSKGALDGLFAAIFRKNQKGIRDTLLCGRLADSGLLDRVAVERLTAEDSLLTDTSFYRLVELTGYELWARSV